MPRLPLAPCLLCLCLLTAGLPATARAADLVVEALLPNTAVIRINGSRQTLRAGQSFDGVTLVNANANAAVVEVGGKRQTLKLNQLVTTKFQEPAERKVDIPRDGALQYRTSATINGRRTQVIVDTGANIVAMNSGHARALGVDISEGRPARMETASGQVAAHAVQLLSVDVGGIRVDNVEAIVAEGGFPSTVLLGMSYLKHVQMQEANGILSISRDW